MVTKLKKIMMDGKDESKWIKAVERGGRRRRQLDFLIHSLKQNKLTMLMAVREQRLR
jgi:hypothetical protein